MESLMTKTTIDNNLNNEAEQSVKTKSSETTQHFLTDENFNLLRKLQSEIFKTIELAPSIKKLVNLLITEENLAKIKAQFIAQHH